MFVWCMNSIDSVYGLSLQIVQQLSFALPCSGIHLAVIHSRTELLNRLLYLASKDPMLRAAVDEQNTLFQVCVLLAAK